MPNIAVSRGIKRVHLTSNQIRQFFRRKHGPCCHVFKDVTHPVFLHTDLSQKIPYKAARRHYPVLLVRSAKELSSRRKTYSRSGQAELDSAALQLLYGMFWLPTHHTRYLFCEVRFNSVIIYYSITFHFSLYLEFVSLFNTFCDFT